MDVSNDNGIDEEYYFTGVPTTPRDLYVILLFFLVLYLVGDCFCSRVLKIVPSLVGYILVGIVFGPEGLGVLGSNNSNNGCGVVETLVVLGNIGLVLLIVQAGLEMDYATLRMVGLRGVVIAVMGTILPVAIGTGIASNFVEDWRSALAAGCSFGPTSAGIAMNVLGQCEILEEHPTNNTSSNNSNSDNSSSNNNNNNNNNNSNGSENEHVREKKSILHLPVGQLIVAAAIVDDILALVVLSQLQALKNDNEEEDASSAALDIAIPIISAILWLVGGGAIALWVFPKLLSHLLRTIPCWKNSNGDGSLSLVVLLGLLYLLLLGTYFSRASYLLGAFLSGLAFCQDTSGVEKRFRQQFQKPMEYLMKLFFAASIGFQVPVRSFGEVSIIGRGFLFALALTGKLAVGLLAPNFYARVNKEAIHGGENTKDKSIGRFSGKHLRDCFVVGFSMMGEAEFAFVVAVFGVSEGLVPPDVYASIVWAILLSTVISPLLLKSTLAFVPYRRSALLEDLSMKDIDGDSKTES